MSQRSNDLPDHAGLPQPLEEFREELRRAKYYQHREDDIFGIRRHN
jgi:hypothetical protein